MSDDEFLAAFEAGTLPRSEWTHAAHVRMAWLTLKRFHFQQALKRIRDGIRRYNAAQGGPPSAYQETITVGFTHLIHARMTASARGEDFADFRARNHDLFDRALTALLRHYERETLQSATARATFVEPDREPFPALEWV